MDAAIFDGGEFEAGAAAPAPGAIFDPAFVGGSGFAPSAFAPSGFFLEGSDRPEPAEIFGVPLVEAGQVAEYFVVPLVEGGAYYPPPGPPPPAPVPLARPPTPVLVRDFYSDPRTGDWAVIDGDFVLVGDGAAVPQQIKHRVLLWLREYWLDESVGVDWAAILVKNPDPILVRELIRRAIADVPDVINVIGAQLQLSSDRTGSISFTVQTAYSVNPISGEVSFP